MSQTTIELALATLLDNAVKGGTIPGITEAQVAWEDQAFTPVANTPYLSTKVAVNGTPVGAGLHGIQGYTGMYNIRVNTANGQGPLPALAIRDAILALFKRQTVTTTDGTSVVIENATAQASYAMGAWRMQTVTVTFSAYEAT